MEIIKNRRSIRKYTAEQVPLDAAEKVVEAGLYAPNAGGRQGTIIVLIRDKALAETVGKLNLSRFDRSKLSGSYVSSEQPSVIDDPNVVNGLYGAPCVIAVFAEKNFLYSIFDAFCAAENMVLEATELGLASCIVARGEETFDSDFGKSLLTKWKVPSNMICRCFVLLGFADGAPPRAKPRCDGRKIVVEK